MCGPHNTLDFYLRRAAASRQMANAARSPSIADIHYDLAKRYDKLAEDARAHEARNRKRKQSTGAPLRSLMSSEKSQGLDF